MKKYTLIIAAILLMVLSACTDSKDITIIRSKIVSKSFKINPSTVISGFEELQAGDLTVISSNMELRVRLLIYNENGQLVAKDTQYFSDYSHIMTSNVDVDEFGSYKAMVITDIRRKSDSLEFWTINGEENLNSLIINNTGYLGGENNILGISNYDFDGNTSSQININVQPAGALMVVYYMGIRALSYVTEYQLAIDKSTDSVTFTSDALPEWNIKSSSDFDWRISNIELADFDDTVENVYEYVFALPYGQTKIELQGYNMLALGSSWFALTETAYLNLGRGTEYYVCCDIEEREIVVEQFTKGSCSSLFEIQANTLPVPSKQKIKRDLIRIR